MARTKRQFGMGLSFPNERISIGIGPGDRPMEGLGAGYMEPTVLIDDVRTTLTPCGIDLELVKAPGETPDHIVIWYAKTKILFCGDNFYSSFPMLYAIRGTAYRDFNAWVDSLDLLLMFTANILAPGHTMPVIGEAKVQEFLTDYRDAIKSLVAQTADGMNRQLVPDDLAHNVHLPANLANKPYLKEFYGKVAWSVRAYFAGTLGWFDGNPTNLMRLSSKQRGEKTAQLAGGSTALLSAAENAAMAQDHQWVLELTDHLIAIDEQTEAAKKLKIAALREMADSENNAVARNYYLLSAQELEQTLA